MADPRTSLLSATGLGRATRFLLAPRVRPLGGGFGTLMPFRDLDDRPVLLAAALAGPPPRVPVAVFQRREFVDSLEYPVVSTLELFDAWCRQDWAAIREAVGVVSTATTFAAYNAAPAPAGEGGKRPWWARGRKNS